MCGERAEKSLRTHMGDMAITHSRLHSVEGPSGNQLLPWPPLTAIPANPEIFSALVGVHEFQQERREENQPGAQPIVANTAFHRQAI